MTGARYAGPVTHRRWARIAGPLRQITLGALAIGGCHRGALASASVSDASKTPVAVSCATAQTPTAPTTGVPAPRALPVGVLLLTLRTEPPAPPASEATVRLEGETSRSTVKVDPRLSARFELAPGLYDLRVALDGYVSLLVRVTLTAGCTAEVSPTLRGRTSKEQ